MSYAQKFDKAFPMDAISVVIAAARGTVGKKEGASAGLYALGCGVQFLPDDASPVAPPMPPTPAPGPTPIMSMSDEDLATHLEGCLPKLGAGETTLGPGAIIVIQTVLPLVQLLLKRWFPALGS
jgi:hypothetical protein